MSAAAPLPGQQPGRIGPYRVVRRLGAGGMGAVYLGYHHHTGAPAAVKVIRPEYATDPGYRARLRREVAAARRVPRFCTAPVLAADLAAPQPWVATEYIDGPTLDAALLAQPRLTGAQLDTFAAGVAVALRAIHQHGIVHRDLKPSNILLSPLGPRVIDFGIARLDAADTRLTRTGALVGTPAYMAPEQLRGEPPTTAVDVFAWAGVVTYAATGAPPFGTGEPALPAILYAQPVLADLAEPLRGLVSAAFAKDPAARPTAAQLVDQMSGAAPAATAQVLAAAARPPEPQRPPRRRRWAVALAAVLAAVLAAAAATAGAAGWFAPGGSPGSPAAGALPGGAVFGDPLGEPLPHPDEVQAVAAGQLRGTPIAVAGGGTTVRVWDLVTRERIHELSSGSTVFSVAFGEVAGTPVVAAGTYDGTVRLWGLDRGQGDLVGELAGHTDRVTSITFGTLDQEPVAITASRDGTARIWSLTTYAPSGGPLSGHTGAVASVAIGEISGTAVAVTGGGDGTVRLWNLDTRQQAAVLRTGADQRVTAVAISERAGTPVAVWASDRSGELRIWDLAAHQEVDPPLDTNDTMIASVAVTALAAGPIAVTASHDQLRVWDFQTGQQIRGVLTGHTGRITAVAIGTVGGAPVAVSGSTDETVRVWNLGGR